MSLPNHFPGTPKSFLVPPISFQRQIDQQLVDSILKFITYSFKNLNKLGLNQIVVLLSGSIPSTVLALFIPYTDLRFTS